MCVHVHLCARVSKHVCVRVHVKCLSVSLCAHMHHVYTCVLCMCVCIECVSVCARTPGVCLCAHVHTRARGVWGRVCVLPHRRCCKGADHFHSTDLADY